MIHGLGIDIVENARIRRLYDTYGDHFLRRFFTDDEQRDLEGRRDKIAALSGKFAGKEAVIKALGRPGGVAVFPADIGIVHDSHGAPIVKLSERLKTLLDSCTIRLSISHERNYAAAVAIVIKEKADG